MTRATSPRQPPRRASPRRRPQRRGGLGARPRRDRRRGAARGAVARTARDPPSDRRGGPLRRSRRGAGLYRDALWGRCPPAACPTPSVKDVPDALLELVAPLLTARTARSRPTSCTGRYGVDAGAVLREARARRRSRPRRASPRRRRPRLVRDRGPASPQARLARGPAQGDRAGRAAATRRLPPVLAGRRSPLRRGRRPRPAARDPLPLQGIALPAETWERDVLPRRTGAYSQSWLDQPLRQRRGRMARRGARSDAPDAWRSTFREDAPLIGPPAGGGRAHRRQTVPSTSSCGLACVRAHASSATCSPSSTRRPRRCARPSGISYGLERRQTTPGRHCARPTFRWPGAGRSARSGAPVAARSGARRSAGRASRGGAARRSRRCRGAGR